jgi:hypothetical protein
LFYLDYNKDLRPIAIQLKQEAASENPVSLQDTGIPYTVALRAGDRENQGY